MKKVFFILVTFIFSAPSFAQWELVSPGTKASVFGTSPLNPTRLYSGYNLWTASTDNGVNWIWDGTGVPYVSGSGYYFTVLSSNAYFGDFGAGYTNPEEVCLASWGSPGSAHVWGGITTGLTYAPNQKAGPNEFAIVDTFTYISTIKGIYRMRKAIYNWQRISIPDTAAYSIVNKNNILYVGYATQGIKMSNDKGFSWAFRNGGLTLGTVKQIKQAGNYLYAGNTVGKVFKTTNDGVNWTDVSPGITVEIKNIYTIDSANVFINTTKDIYRTTNGGINWMLFNEGIPVTSSLVGAYRGFIKFGNYLFAGMTDGIYRRTLSPPTGSNPQTNIIKSFELEQNYPNPFNPSTQINFELRNKNYVTLKVYDLIGNEIATLVSENKNAGNYSVTFVAGKYNLSSGMYFYKLSAGGLTDTKRMVLIK